MQAESLEQKHARLHSHDKRWCQHVPTMSDLTARRGTSNLIGDDCRMSQGFELRVLESPLFPTSLCGVLVFGSVSRRPSASRRLTHNLPTHNLLTYTLSSHILSSHNLLTHNLSSHNLLTHNLSTHNLLTYTLSSHILSSHNLVIAQLAHTTCSHTTCPHTTCHHTTCSLTHILSSHTQLVHFAWQAWHLRHWAGSGGAPGSQMTPWMPRLFAWQAWQLVTSTLTLRGRRGTW